MNTTAYEDANKSGCWVVSYMEVVSLYDNNNELYCLQVCLNFKLKW